MVALLRLASGQRWALAGALVAMAVSALATAGYAFLLGPLFEALFAGPQRANSTLVGLLSWFPWVAGQDLEGLAKSVWLLPLVIFAVASARASATWVQRALMAVAGERAVSSLRVRAYTAMISADFLRLHGAHSGDWISRLTRDADRVRDALADGVTILVRDGLTAAALLGLALSLDAELAVVALVAVPVAALQARFFARRLRSAYRRADRLRGELAGRAHEALANIETVKVDAAAELEVDRFDRGSEVLASVQVGASSIRAAGSAMMELAGVGGLGLTLAYAIWRINAGELEPAAFLSFFAALMLLYEPLRGLGRVNANLQAGASALERLEELLELPPELCGGIDPTPFRQMELRGVSLCYAGGPMIFEDLDLTLNPGSALRVSGPSGAGKSSLLRLLLGLVPPSSGEFVVDGRRVQDLDLAAFRRQIGYAGQEVLLFNATVAENLRLARPGATDAELVQACQAAAAADFIEELPLGYATEVGQRGHRLSGGQRQRLALARALLKEPAMLVLDEALTGLDLDMRRRLIDGIAHLNPKLMLVVVSHSDDEGASWPRPMTELRLPQTRPSHDHREERRDG